MKAICLLILVCFTNLFASTTFLRSEKILLHTERADYKQGDTLRFSGTLLEATTLEPSAYSNYVYIELINKDDSVLCRQKYRCKEAGFKGELFLETDLPTSVYYLRAYTRLMRNFSPTAFTVIKVSVNCELAAMQQGQTPAYVTFYPEGGHLFCDGLQHVAFEVKDENGLPVQTTASLCKASSDTLFSRLATDAYGIGTFSFIPESSSRHYLQIGSCRFPCPSVSSDPVLQLNQNRSKIYYKILMPADDMQNYTFLLFHRGAVCLQQSVDVAHSNGIVSLTDYTSGLLAGILLDNTNRVVSETLIYYNAPDEQPDRFTSEEKASLLNADLSKPLPDLPLYMDSANPEALKNLRSRLLTRKWGRFMWQDVLKDSYDYTYKPEEVLTLSGSVETESGRPLKKGTLIAINNNNGFTYDADIAKGRFIIGVDDYKEGNSFFLQAYNEKGKSYGYKIFMDNDTFPGVVNLYKELSAIKDVTASVRIDSAAIYSENRQDGAKTFHLPSITVTARIKKEIPSTKEFYAVNFLDEKVFEDPPYPSIIPYLERMIGFKVYQDTNTQQDDETPGNGKYVIRTTRGAATLGGGITREGGELIVLLDGYPVDTSWALETLHPADIRSIERLTPSQALRYTSSGFAGAIHIRTKGYKKADVKSEGTVYVPIGLSDI